MGGGDLFGGASGIDGATSFSSAESSGAGWELGRVGTPPTCQFEE